MNDESPINRDLKRVRDQAEQARRYQQRIDNVDRIVEANQAREKAYRERGTERHSPATSPVVWFFGLIGAFVCGVIQPFGTDWFCGGSLGFIGAGVAAGVLSQYEKGRIALWIVGLACVAFVVAAIVLAPRE